MATKVELKASITKWKKVIANPKTKDSVKKILKKSIDKAEKQITDLEGAIEQSKKAALPSAVKSSGQKTAAQLIKEAKDRRQSQGLSTRQSDVEKDAGRKAKPKGYRISKYGNKYWEGRDNRIDVKQPPITYPKLEDGGYMAKGGSLASFKQKFEDNEDQNYHSENVVLLAETFGNDNDIKESKEILAKHLKERGLSKENSEKRDVLFYKLVAKARKEMSKEGISFEDGGMMANGGGVYSEKDFKNMLPIHLDSQHGTSWNSSWNAGLDWELMYWNSKAPGQLTQGTFTLCVPGGVVHKGLDSTFDARDIEKDEYTLEELIELRKNKF